MFPGERITIHIEFYLHVKHSDKHNSTIQAICKIELTSVTHIQIQNIKFKTFYF